MIIIFISTVSYHHFHFNSILSPFSEYLISMIRENMILSSIQKKLYIHAISRFITYRVVCKTYSVNIIHTIHISSDGLYVKTYFLFYFLPTNHVAPRFDTMTAWLAPFCRRKQMKMFLNCEEWIYILKRSSFDRKWTRWPSIMFFRWVWASVKEVRAKKVLWDKWEEKTCVTKQINFNWVEWYKVIQMSANKDKEKTNGGIITPPI